MIPAKSIIDKTNQYIGNTSITDLQFTQLSAVDNFLANSGITVVAASGLPAAADYVGVTVYVSSEQQYYFSDGVVWRKEFASDYEVQNNTLYAFGRGSFGQLGDNTTSSRSSPVTVVGGLTNWKQIAGGTFHTVGVTIAGIAYAWGAGNDGRLGTGSTTNQSSPVTVAGGITNWTQIGVGTSHSIGLTTSGLIYAWGLNSSGQLGDGTDVAKSSPVTVAGGITNWKQIAGCGTHNLAITSAGIAYAWGNGYTGRLGNNQTQNLASPVSVVGGITNWSNVAHCPAGSHSLAATAAGLAYGWGPNSSGQLGTNNTSGRSSPVLIAGGITTWAQLAGGASHSLGLTSSGLAYAWGYNGQGRLGNGTTTNTSSPVTIIGGITDWRQITGGQNFSLGLRSSGIAYGWGNNAYGQLGDNTISSRTSPVTYVGGITNWSHLSAGYRHSHAIATATLVTKGFV